MIEETSRNYATPIENIEDEKQAFEVKDAVDVNEPEKAFDEKLPQESELKVNRFFIQLFICSLLLWSLLFMKDTRYEHQVTQTIKQVLKQNIQSEPIQDFISEVEVAVKQIL